MVIAVHKGTPLVKMYTVPLVNRGIFMMIDRAVARKNKD